MSFKIHLIIVSVIIVAVYFFWQSSVNKPPEPPPTPTEIKNSKYSIKIVHATWGKNCEDDFVEVEKPKSDPFAYNPQGETSKIKDDNVLEIVAGLCDGKLKCSIPLTPETLGDPAPNCRIKALNVEYRCFAFDRPWEIQGTDRMVNIDCDRPDTP